MTTIELRPTVQGLKHMRRMFQETIADSKEKIEACDAYLNGDMAKRDIPDEIICAALELMLQHEAERIEKMKEGIEEVNKGIPAGE